MEQTTVNLVNQLTLAAAAIIACGVLWRAYNKSHLDHIEDLRKFGQDGLYDLRARMMVLEDKNGVQRSERFGYMSPANAAEQRALDDLDMKKEKTYSDKTSEWNIKS